MNRTARLVVGALLIGIGLVALLSLLATRSRETNRQTFDGVTSFVFDTDNSPVDIVTGDGATVVEADASTGLFGARIDLDQDGGTLNLVQRCPIFPFGIGCRASFEVILPVDVDVSGQTSNGSITLTDVGGSVEVESSNGSITLTGLTADATARTSNGSISGTGLASAIFEAITSNGSIDVAFRSAPSAVTIDTSNGSVDLILPSDSPPYDLSTSTSNGRVTTEVRTDPAATQTIDVETSNGDIAVRYSN